MDPLGIQEFMAGISVNVGGQSFDNLIEKIQHQHQNQALHHHHPFSHHNHHNNNHHHPHQAHSNHQHPQQQSNHSPSPTNSGGNLFSLFDFPYSPETSKLGYNSASALDNGGMDTPTPNDGEMSNLAADIANSDDGLNISAEDGSISFMRDGVKVSSKKSLDKGSDEYKKRRERNNVAVRKSREKAKQRSKDTEKKVNELQNENDNLKRTVGELSGKMMILRRLLDEVGVAGDYVDEELSRSFTEPHRSKGGGDY